MEQPSPCKGVDLSLYIRGEVMQMSYDFKDLMSFGMFLIALLTLILQICQ